MSLIASMSSVTCGSISSIAFNVNNGGFVEVVEYGRFRDLVTAFAIFADNGIGLEEDSKSVDFW